MAAQLTHTTNLVLPTVIEAQGIAFKQVSCGKNHLAAITQNGKLQVPQMEINNLYIFSVTWGNPDDGKLGHQPKVMTEEEKKKKFEQYRRTGYTPRNYAERNEIDFVAGELADKRVVHVACGF